MTTGLRNRRMRRLVIGCRSTLPEATLLFCPLPCTCDRARIHNFLKAVLGVDPTTAKEFLYVDVSRMKSAVPIRGPLYEVYSGYKNGAMTDRALLAKFLTANYGFRTIAMASVN